jgi:hypothetical protein
MPRLADDRRRLTNWLWIAAGIAMVLTGTALTHAQTAGGFKVVLTGDAILDRQLSVYGEPRGQRGRPRPAPGFSLPTAEVRLK